MSLIVFEGCDGSGKTTQLGLLSEYLEQCNIDHVCLKCPNRSTPSGSIINKYLTGDAKFTAETINLVLLANIWEVAEDIQAALAADKIVLLDRYYFTHIAYSMARGSSMKNVGESCRGLLQPDAIIYLDVDINTALSRKTGPLEILERPEFQEKVKKYYDIIKEPSWIIVGANGDKATIHNTIVHELKKIIKKFN